MPGLLPCWALSWPESCIVVPATLVFGLGCLQRGRGARKTQKTLRYTRVLAPLGSVVAGILRSCSGYASFWPWLLASGPRRQENAKTRVCSGKSTAKPLLGTLGLLSASRGFALESPPPNPF